MQKLDEQKRKDILKAAEKLFVAKAFHEVKLDEVALRARIGKGTIYIYFKSKEDLFASVISEGVLEMIVRITQGLSSRPLPAMKRLELIISELVDFAAARPRIFQLLRTILPKACENRLNELRSRLHELIRDEIQRGVDSGELNDPVPGLTAQFILSSVRGAVLFRGSQNAPDELKRHLMWIYGAALTMRRELR